MPNFFSSLFSSSPKPVQSVQFVSGRKVTDSPKTVQEVLGIAFDYKGSISAKKVFCKKILRCCAREFSTENMLFLLVCEKYRNAPNSGLFNLIYDDFIRPGSPKEVNISSQLRLPITTLSQLGDPGSSAIVFDAAVSEIYKLFERDSLARLVKAPFASAFTLNDAQQREFDAAVNYLSTYQITLL